MQFLAWDASTYTCIIIYLRGTYNPAGKCFATQAKYSLMDRTVATHSNDDSRVANTRKKIPHLRGLYARILNVRNSETKTLGYPILRFIAIHVKSSMTATFPWLDAIKQCKP